MKVLGFIHSYSASGNLDSYMNSLVGAFINKGIEFHLILANDLLEGGYLDGHAYRKDLKEESLIGWIKTLNPDMVFTSNHAGLTPKIVESLSCPIVTWMVDRVPFRHFQGDEMEVFSEKEIVITSSRNNVPQLQRIYPKLKGRVHFLPFATDAMDFRYEKHEKIHNISFVGTYFYRTQEVHKILQDSISDGDVYERVLGLIGDIEENYNLDLDASISKHQLEEVIKRYGYDKFLLKAIIGNMISMNSRIQYLDAVSDLGLSLFGTDNWVEAGTYSTQLLRCYRAKEKIWTRDALLNVYGASKISLNIPHHQSVSGLPYRVYDIMASPSLLVTQDKEHSDLYHLFGEDVPVPVYKNQANLREIVQYYLKNESEREDMVLECNRRIMDGKFRFVDRVDQIFAIAGLKNSDFSTGKLIKVDITELLEVPEVVIAPQPPVVQQEKSSLSLRRVLARIYPLKIAYRVVRSLFTKIRTR